MKKKILSMLVTLCMVVAVFPITASAAADFHMEPTLDYEYIQDLPKYYKNSWIVVDEGKTGIINTQGEFVIPLTENVDYLYVDDFVYLKLPTGDFAGQFVKYEENKPMTEVYTLLDGEEGDYEWDGIYQQSYYEVDTKALYWVELQEDMESEDYTSTLLSKEVEPNDYATVVTVVQTLPPVGAVMTEPLGYAIMDKGVLTSGTPYYYDAYDLWNESTPDEFMAIVVNEDFMIRYVNVQGTNIFGEGVLFENGSAFASQYNVAAVQQNGKWGFVNRPGVTATTPAPAPGIVGAYNNSTLIVNSETMELEVYTINQNNYFKLRDLAAIANGTDKQFEVTWDGAKNAINLVSDAPYTTVDGELVPGDGTDKAAVVNTSTIYLDGNPVELAAYTIKGNNYFKLRDVCRVFDIGVTWDGATSTVGIDTSIGYTD